MHQAVTANQANGSSLAFLEDHTRVRKGQKQLYGTQINVREGEQLILEPFVIKEPDLLDQRRHKVGLELYAQYLESGCALYREHKKEAASKATAFRGS